MTTEAMGRLPFPECNTASELKTDGRKHTLKCHHCGVLAYDQSRSPKQQIKGRLNVQGSTHTAVAGSKGAVKEQINSVQHRHTGLAQGQTLPIMLQPPDDTSEAQQCYILSIEPVANEVEVINHEFLKATNDEQSNDHEPEPTEGKGLFNWL